MVIADQENATFAFVALANVFCCYLSMALVFVPKVRNSHMRADLTFNPSGCLHHPAPGTRPQGEGGRRREEEAGAGVQVEEAAEGE